ncbi:hypothetical protein Trydic_g21205 [Trypoxylus dichotomus]
MEKGNGPNMDPCGTSGHVVAQSDAWLLANPACYRRLSTSGLNIAARTFNGQRNRNRSPEKVKAYFKYKAGLETDPVDGKSTTLSRRMIVGTVLELCAADMRPDRRMRNAVADEIRFDVYTAAEAGTEAMGMRCEICGWYGIMRKILG